MISFDSTGNIMPGGGAPLASSDESPCMPVSKLPYFCFSIHYTLPMRPTNKAREETREGGAVRCCRGLNETVLMRQFSLCVIVHCLISKPQDFEMRIWTG